MTTPHDDALQAGRLIQWGLRPKALPFNEPEYRELLRQYEDRSDFRALVQGCAEGLGLAVLAANERGLFLGTKDDSVFTQLPSSFRTGQVSGDDRLLDGLVELGIAATIFPRQRDLEDDILEARPPVTVADVDATIRELVDVLKQQHALEPKSDADRIDQGLWEAWQVYESRPQARRTRAGRISSHSAHGLIELHLARLVELGCFTVDRQDTLARYRPTLRYQVLIQELAATRLYQRVQEAMCSKNVPLKPGDGATRDEEGAAHA